MSFFHDTVYTLVRIAQTGQNGRKNLKFRTLESDSNSASNEKDNRLVTRPTLKRLGCMNLLLIDSLILL
jgi:hypothetical protein